MVLALESKHPYLVLETLQSLDALLALDKYLNLQGENQICYKFELAKGLDSLETLQSHPNVEIYKAVEHLVKKYFGEDDEGPVSSNQGNGRMEHTSFNI